MSGSSKLGTDTFDHENAELRRWPYVSNLIDGTLDAELIEGKGKQLLFQALSNKTLLAFVGSGLSAAYGRLTWREWQERQVDRLGQIAEAFGACCKESRDMIEELKEILTANDTEKEDKARKALREAVAKKLRSGGENTPERRAASGLDAGDKHLSNFLNIKLNEIKFRALEVDRLSNTLSLLKAADSIPGGEPAPVIFQAAEKLKEALGRNDDLFAGNREGDFTKDPTNLVSELSQNATPGFATGASAGPAAEISAIVNTLKNFAGRNSGPNCLNTFEQKRKKYSEALERFLRLTQVEEVNLSFSDLTKVLMVDECAQAEAYLWQATRYEKAVGRKNWDSRKGTYKRFKDINDQIRRTRPAIRPDNLHRKVKGIREFPERFWSLGFFRSTTIEAVAERLLMNFTGYEHPLFEWVPMLERIKVLARDNGDPNDGLRREHDRRIVSPTHRFVFEMMVDLLEEPYEKLNGWKEDTRKPDSPIYYSDIIKTDFQSRHSLIDTDLDPIEKLVMEMGIKRYLTTNYDMEIERFFHDRGYRKYESAVEENADGSPTDNGDGPGIYRVDELGGLFKDHTFERDSASDLVGFAVDDADADAHVFHLHGRATDNSKIVVTERDYMDLYLRNDRNRDSVDESIRLAFSGNPLFFVGLGMQEADVLRPLRQFMSDKDRAIDRTAIVLYAADKPKAQRASTATGLYLRYGVHTIFFGSGRIQCSTETGTQGTIADTSAEPIDVDWLHYTVSLIQELRSINTDFQEILYHGLALQKWLAGEEKDKPEAPPCLSNDWSGPAILDRIVEGLAKLDKDFNNGKREAVLNVLLGRSKDHSLSVPTDLDDLTRLAPVNFVPKDDYTREETISPTQAAAHGDRFLKFECYAIFEILKMTCSFSGHIPDAVQGIQGLSKFHGKTAAAQRKSANIEKTLALSLRDVRARLVALNGLQTAIMTGALCASLDALKSEWQTWWTHWRQSPPHRVARFERKLPGNFGCCASKNAECPDPKKAVDLQAVVHPPLRYVRHLLDNKITDLQKAETYGCKVELLNLQPDSRQSRSGLNLLTTTEGSPSSEQQLAKRLERPTTDVRAFDTFLDAVVTEQARLPWFDAVTSARDAESSLEHRAEIISTKQPMTVTHARIGSNPLDLRRTYLVAAKRGLGKGTFFSAFFSTLGLSSYIQAAWPISHRSRHPYFLSAFFVNFSFSSEIASSYDMLIDALIETNVALTALPEWEAQRAHDHIRSNLRTFAEEPGTNIHDLMLLYPELSAKLREQAIGLFDLVRTDPPDLTGLVGIMSNAVIDPGEPVAPRLAKLQIYKHAIRETLSGLPRLEMLTHLFKAFCRLSKAVRIHRANTTLRPRLLLVINALELLHYAGGLPKNREIEGFLRILSSEEFSRVPIDIVFISSEQNIGEIFVRETPFLKSYRNAYRALRDRIGGTEFRTPSEPDADVTPPAYKMHFVSIERHDLPVTGRSNVALRQNSSGIECLPVDAADRLPLQDRGFVHFGREANSERILVDNFRVLATFLFLLDVSKRLNEIARTTGGMENYLSIIDPLLDSKNVHNSIFQEKNPFHQWDMAAIELDKFCTYFTDSVSAEKKISRRAKLDRIVGKYYGKPDSDMETRTVALLLARYDPSEPTANHKAIREWRDIGRSFRQNRYCMTILLAAAQRIALGARSIRDGAERAEAFIRRVADEAATASSSRVEQVVLDKVLDAHERFHILGKPANDLELQMLVMRHLAVVGAPCSVDVLVRMPEIRQYFDEILRKHQESRREMLAEALDSMVSYGLVFKVHPHPRLVQLYYRLGAAADDEVPETRRRNGGARAGPKTNADLSLRYFDRVAPKDEAEGKPDQEKTGPAKENRYTLHRLTQRHVVQKMGSGPHEYIEINSFAPSTYASMPSELPRLTHEAYTFLNTLVAALSQYPDHPRTGGSTESWHLGGAPLSTRVQALRAALCVVRSTFSVAVVSRFEEYKHLGTGDDDPERGYFEAYRVQVRWIIRKAWELLDQKEIGTEYDPAGEWRHVNALYRDEIAWLYNECGLICLVQGNLIDAVALLRQAIRFNRVIEGPLDGGAQHNRISLNLAIVQIERGRLSAARRRLESIQATEFQASGRRGRLWFIVHGYLGFISHLGGDREAASRRYREALAILEVYNDRRACSIFSRHLGDLERTQGNLEAARRHITEAISFAEAGGHEDLHKKARLALIRLDIEEMKAGPSAAQGHSHAQSFVTRIGVIEDYAHVMEMPALLCEALHARASFLADHGETALAGTLLTRAMAIAKRNGMALRLNRSMTLYASVLSARGLQQQARRLLFGCLEMAKRHGNQIEIERIESAFDQS